MTRIRLYPYKMGSRGAKSLQAELQQRGADCLRVRQGGRYRGRSTDLLINWGNSNELPTANEANVLNHWLDVYVACNKLSTFQELQAEGVPVPEFTTIKGVANEWLQSGAVIVVRTLLRASGGRGIIIVNNGDVLPDAPLYVKYVKRKAEYRIHVFNGRVIDAQQKKKRRGSPEVNTQVRNAQNGWVYCRTDVVIPDAVSNAAIDAVRVIGLDFGAVDIIWNEHYRQAYVLEINTAPGLEGQTISAYADAILAMEV